MIHRSRLLVATAASGALLLSACGGGFEENSSSGGSSAPAASSAGSADAPSGSSAGEGSGDQASLPPAELTMLIASSGDAETKAVKAAAKEWGEKTGSTVKVQVASDMNQELAQGMAAGSPPDIFYLEAARVADHVKAGNLHAYEAADNDTFYQSLRDSFTVDGTQYCAPKDFSTLGLQINTEAWKKAGLTDADIPQTYDQLAEVAKKLTTDGQKGLVISPGMERAGAFVVGSGGWWLNDEKTEATASSDQVKQGLQYLQDNMKAGSFALSNQVDTGWGGEAFGNGKAAMTVEGNWIKGAMKNDFPKVKYQTVEMPEGPGGKGTLLFTQCWGVAAKSDAKEQAVSLVNHLTSEDQQMAFADAFGVMPSRESLKDKFAKAYPDDAAFVAGGDYGKGPINAAGMEPVVADMNSQLENLGEADIASVTESFDSNAGAVLGQ